MTNGGLPEVIVQSLGFRVLSEGDVIFDHPRPFRGWSLHEQLSPVALIVTALVGCVGMLGGSAPTIEEPAVTGRGWLATPIVSPDEAVAAARNHLAEIADGWRVDQPRHRVTFTSEGVDFQPGQGPAWHWHLDSIGSWETPQADVDCGPVRPQSVGPTRVSYPRGPIEERYELRPGSIEQQFILFEAPNLGGGDLVVAGSVRSTGRYEAAPNGWLWRTPAGVVSLGNVRVFDAAGSPIAARMEVAARSTRIVVDGATLSRARYPVTVDPEIGSNDFRISEVGSDGDPSRDASDPAVAYNSTDNEYLVVWQGDDPGAGLADDDFQILGQRIDAVTGLLVGGPFRISDLGVGDPDLGAFNPAVAYNGTDNEYLVVWQGDDDAGSSVEGEHEIFGQRLDADPASFGEVGGNDFRISDMGPDGNVDFGAFNPAVAYNATDNEYFVVWEGDDNSLPLVAEEYEIFGQRLDADPASFGEVGTNDFRLSDMGASDGNRDFGAFNPAVIYNRVAGEYLVVWDGDDDSGSLVEGEREVFGQRLDAEPASFGEVGANDFRISDMGVDGNRDFGAFSPAVAHNRIDNLYLVVWQGDDQTPSPVAGELEIFGQQLDASGGETGSNDFRISDMGSAGQVEFGAFRPAVTHNPTDNQFLVVWDGDDNSGSLVDGEFEIFGQQLDSAGAAVGTNDFRISDMGTLDGDALFDALRPAVIYNSARNESLVVWQGDDDSGALVNDELEIYGQLLGVVADLAVTQQAAPDPIVAGTTLTYTLTVANSGPHDAANVILTDTLPAGVTLVSTAGCAEDPAGVPSCHLGTLAAGSSRQVTVTVVVSSGTLGVIANSATVTSATADPDPSDNSVTADVLVIGEADVSVTKSDSQDPVAAGAPLTYSLTVSNAGPSDAADVMLVETLPSGVTFGASSGCLNDPNGVPLCDLGSIAAGTSRQVTVTVTVHAATAGTITNQAIVTSETSDPGLANNTALEDTLVDGIAPVVSLLSSLSDTGDGVLEECENTKVSLRQLLVTFSEEVRDPAGDTDPDDVTNPANYLLVAAGPDRDFDTSVCGPASGDDQVVAIDAVLFSSTTRTAALTLNGGAALRDSLYRLLVCGSTSIRDIAGNALDGDGNGIGGDDFRRTYRVDRANLFENSSFDCSIDEWVTVSTLPQEIEHSPQDVDGSLVSGAARVTNLSASTDFSLGQCVATPPIDYRLGGWIRVDAAPGVRLSVARVCEFFSLAGCGGSPLAVHATVAFVGDTAGGWQFLESVGSAPADTASVLCSYDLRTATGESFDAFLDSASLTREAAIFSDGFESGDTSAWSTAIGDTED